MPAPPRKGEKQQAFISRCIKHYVGKEDWDNDRAAAACYDMWRRRHKTRKKAKSRS